MKQFGFLVLLGSLGLVGCNRGAVEAPPKKNPDERLTVSKDQVDIRFPEHPEGAGYDLNDEKMYTQPLGGKTPKYEMKGKIELLEKKRVVVTLEYEVKESTWLEVRNDGMENWEVTRDGTKVVEPLVELSSGKHTVIVRADRPGK